MKKEIYRSNYVVVWYEKEYSLFSKKWFPNTAEMPDESYQHEMLEYARLVKEYKPEKELVDTKDFFFLIAPELQTWFEKNIVQVYHDCGLTKAALIASSDFVGQLSLEQAMNEGRGKQLTKRFFSNELSARSWLLE